MKCMLQYLFLIIAGAFALQPNALSQVSTADSLISVLSKAKSDTQKMWLHFEIAGSLTGYDLQKAEAYLDSGYKLAKEQKNPDYISYYYRNKGGLLFEMARYKQATLYYDSALNAYSLLIQKEKDAKKKERHIYGKVDCFIGKGLLSAKLYHYNESIKYYLQGVEECNRIATRGENAYLATLYANIASDYYELEEFENSLKYDKQVLPYLDSTINTHMYVIGLLFVADDFSALSKFDSAFAYIEKVRPAALRLNKPAVNIRYYGVLGTIYQKMEQWVNAIFHFQKANEAALKLNDEFQFASNEEGLANCYVGLGNLAKAKQLALNVLAASDRLNVPIYKVKALHLLSMIEEKAGNIAQAYQYQKQYIAISDSVKKEKVQHQMNETEAKYQNEKKQKEIAQLEKDRVIRNLLLRQRTNLNYILIASLAAFLIVGLLIYRNLRHRQLLAKQQEELQQQKIRELEKDRQLIAVDSMLKGQEEERNRLAKDLHDGLGGMLSGVKFSLMNMKSNLIIDHENVKLFERSLDMLDTSIQELRRVAHNMMPEALVKFGLDEALKDYFTNINNAKIVDASYQSFGMEERIDNTTEIIVYRIVQELLNNIFKHARATHVLVQLVRERDRLTVTVEDNGKGFDTSELERAKGAGWANIRSRVDYLKGKLDLHSEIGKGTSVNIEINV